MVVECIRMKKEGEKKNGVDAGGMGIRSGACGPRGEGIALLLGAAPGRGVHSSRGLGPGHQPLMSQ